MAREGQKICRRGARKYASGALKKYFTTRGKIRPSLGGRYFGPKGKKCPLGGHQISGARPFVRGNHIEGALAPQAAGQRNGPWENDEKSRMHKYNCVCVFPGLLSYEFWLLAPTEIVTERATPLGRKPAGYHPRIT